MAQPAAGPGTKGHDPREGRANVSIEGELVGDMDLFFQVVMGDGPETKIGGKAESSIEILKSRDMARALKLYN